MTDLRFLLKNALFGREANIAVEQYVNMVLFHEQDYFVDPQHERLPSSTREWLSKLCNFKELASLLPVKGSTCATVGVTRCSDERSSGVMPLALLCHRQLCRNLTLQQETSSYVVSDEFSEEMDRYYRTCVKPKKSHEIALMAEVIRSVCENCDVKRVVDIGSGLGHLSRILSFNKNLNVITVEAATDHSPKAHRLDKCAENLLHMKIDNAVSAEASTVLPQHVSSWINSDITVDQFNRIISSHKTVDQLDTRTYKTGEPVRNSIQSDYSAYKPSNQLEDYTHITDSQSEDITNDHNTQSDEMVGLSCLHACGDLTPTVLRMFVNLDCAQVLTSVSCCYMKLSCHDVGGQGFPMSDFVRSLEDYKSVCTWVSRESACHHVYQYYHRLNEEESGLLRHAYRAALQKLLYRRKDKQELVLRKLKIRECEKLTFSTYCKKAFDRLGLAYDVTDDEIKESEQVISYHWKEIVGVYTMRLTLAPLIETFILLDRLVYLYENGIKSRLEPLFNPLLSPRNLILLASKSVDVLPATVHPNPPSYTGAWCT